MREKFNFLNIITLKYICVRVKKCDICRIEVYFIPYIYFINTTYILSKNASLHGVLHNMSVPKFFSLVIIKHCG